MRDFLINSYKQRIDHDTQCRIVQSLKECQFIISNKAAERNEKTKKKSNDKNVYVFSNVQKKFASYRNVVTRKQQTFL